MTDASNINGSAVALGEAQLSRSDYIRGALLDRLQADEIARAPKPILDPA